MLRLLQLWSFARAPWWSFARAPWWSFARAPWWSFARALWWSFARAPWWSFARAPWWLFARAPWWSFARAPSEKFALLRKNFKKPPPPRKILTSAKWFRCRSWWGSECSVTWKWGFFARLSRERYVGGTPTYHSKTASHFMHSINLLSNHWLKLLKAASWAENSAVTSPTSQVNAIKSARLLLAGILWISSTIPLSNCDLSKIFHLHYLLPIHLLYNANHCLSLFYSILCFLYYPEL